MENTDKLREKAERYQRMASRVDDPQAVAALVDLAGKYEAVAAKQEEGASLPNKD